MSFCYYNPFLAGQSVDYSRIMRQSTEAIQTAFIAASGQIEENMRYCNDLMRVHSQEELQKLNTLFVERAVRRACDNAISVMQGVAAHATASDGCSAKGGKS